MGDMNIDLANHKYKTHVPSNARKLLSFTRISSTSKTLIDHAYMLITIICYSHKRLHEQKT